MFERLDTLIGKDKLDLLKSMRILIIGCGGVGGYVVEALVRSGIGHLTVIDSDTVDVSNINRQIIALHSTIGEKKVDVIKKRVLDINPNIDIDALDMRITPDNIEDLELEKYDYVVDAIDDVKAKVALIKFALEHDMKLVVSTGTAKKLHPEDLHITTLDKTSGDPLARVLRSKLRGYKMNKVVVLASSEVPIIDGNTLSSAFVPSIGGLLIASYIVNNIIGM